jgi:TolA-binding protein
VRSDDVNGKIVAPSMEEHASYFSERRKGIPPADLAKADKLRRKTIDSIKDLLENKKGTRRFELLLRLGELYVERHDYMRDYEMATYVKAWDTWSKETDKSKKGPEPKVDFSGSQNELTKAANSFRQLVNEFPKHPRTDAALYSLAQTLARLGKDTAIEYYKQLIKSHPKSPLIPDTYLSLGEYYFDKHQIPEAIEYYKKVMAFKDHRAYLYAVYKLGWANYNAPQKSDADARENYKKAVAAFKLVIKLSDKELKDKKQKANFDLREESIRDLVMVWAEAEDVASAWKYFRSIGEPDAFYKMLERLGNIYYEQGKNDKAIVVFQRLLKDSPKRDSNPQVHAKLVELHDLMNNNNGVIAELKNMQKAYLGDSVWTRANKKSDKGDLVAEAQVLVEKNMHRYGAMFHQRGQKTKSPVYLAAAGTVYSMYLESFAKSSNAYDIRYYLAEILYDFKKFEEASKHYLIVAKQDPKGKYHKPAALNAVAALHDLAATQKFGKLPPLGQVPKPLPVPRVKKLLIDTMDAYLALLPKEKEADNMRFETAQIYFEHGHYPEAIKRFDNLTREIPETKQARSAVKVILGYHADREDWNKLISWGQNFAARKDKLLDDPLRKHVVEVLRGAMFKRALAYEKDQKFERAARSFVEYQKEFPADPSADRALYNATLNFYKVGQIEQALATGKMMMEKYPKSESLPNALADMGSTYEALAKFDEAAALYKRLGLAFPQDKRAPSALYNAAVLYKGLKNYDESISILMAFVKTFGNTKIAGDATLELANLYERTNRMPLAVQTFESYARNFPADGEQVAFAAAKAAVLKTLHIDKAAGTRDLERVRAVLTQKNAPAAFQAREAVAGALFRLADPLFSEFLAYKINDGSKIEKQVGEKQQRLVKLADMYQRIAELGSGEFTVASLYRLGEAHENFSNALFRAPAPKGASQADTDRLKTELEKVAFPLKEEAYKFFETAHKRSTEVQTFTVWTRRTYQKMVELAPDRHPQVDEISADPTYLSHVLKADNKAVAELIEE